MSAKKYPTPNLTAVEAKWYEMDAVHTYNARVRYAVQADIDLAVKAALGAEAPKGASTPTREACGGSGMVNDYVEFGSTSVATPVGCTVCHGYLDPKPAPPEQNKGCGTCAHVGNEMCAGMFCGDGNSFKHWKARPKQDKQQLSDVKVSIVCNEEMKPNTAMAVSTATIESGKLISSNAARLKNIGPPKQDKRCGTCANRDPEGYCLQCPLPHWVSEGVPGSNEAGKWPCWKARP